MLPVRCYTCNNLIGHLEDKLVQMGKDKTCKDIMDQAQLHRICCRRMIVSHINLIRDLMQYSNVDEVVDQSNTRFECRVKHERDVPCD